MNDGFCANNLYVHRSPLVMALLMAAMALHCLTAVAHASPSPFPTPSPCPNYPTPVPLPEGALSDALGQVDQLLAKATQSNQLPGMIASVVLNGEVLWWKGYGSVNASDPNAGPPDLTHYIRMASNTKTLTSMLAFALHQDGTLSLDDEVGTIVPGFSIRQPYPNSQGVKVRGLAGQTSGMARDAPWNECNETLILEQLGRMYVAVPQFTRFHYSNLGFSLLGSVCKHAAKAESFESLIGSRVFGPLNMTTSTFAINDTILNNMAVGFDSGAPAPIVDLCWQNSAGGMITTMNDVNKYMNAILTQNTPLSNTLLDEFLSPNVVFRDGQKAAAYPWEMFYYNRSSVPNTNIWVRGKQGEILGYRSSMMLLPELKFGVFVLALQSTVPAPNVWTNPILDIMIPAVVTAFEKYGPQTPPQPQEMSVYEGVYEGGGVAFEIAPNADGVLVGNGGGVSVTFEAFEYAQAGEYILRSLMNNTLGCRALVGEYDQELAYFTVANGTSTSMYWMGGTFTRTANPKKMN